ncbi:MAG: Z1 domain-containing protein [Pseudomonadota bacterium]
MSNGDFEKVLCQAQMFISSQMNGGPLTREIIAERVETVLAMVPRWRQAVDRERLIRELETRFSIWIGRETSLDDEENHVPWLHLRRNEIPWRYSNRYRLFLGSRWSPGSIDSLDEITDRTLGLLEDPHRPGPWDRRGLVVGHVQSGKTANYNGLICKAADAGYKVIVVLAGIHNNLRSQTQMRLDEGFLGYESMSPREAKKRGLHSIGVGTIDPELRTDTITNRSARGGDFSRTVARNFSINPGGHPLLFVVKKNAGVLKNLLDWVEWASNGRDSETGRRVVKDVPLLVIDDEADHASVNINVQAFDENGQPDLDHDPATINRSIRRLLRFFEKSTYVGYTATPFANIFIHECARTTEDGDDLFPRSFIINLPAPSNYAGPARIFGLSANPEDAADDEPALPLIRHITDHAETLEPGERSGWMPPRHRNGHRPLFRGQPEIPPSLRLAIHSFLLACAARQARDQVRVHNSMLIHVTRFTNVQKAVYNQVREELNSIRRRLRHGDGGSPRPLLSELRQLWLEDFIPSTEFFDAPDYPPVSWESIEPLLGQVASCIEVRQINGSAKDILDYELNRETGLNVIAIGGDKLSRGLTLEGLTVSYFLRASRMYDTLMQMGRWFGYRPGYLDLCRLYTTPELNEWFQHITEANEELWQEFDHMAAVGGTPRDYGLKVRSHPTLMVTSRVKLHSGKELQLSFAGSILETTVFHRDKAQLQQNVRITEALVKNLGEPTERNPERLRPGGGKHVWKGTCLWSGIAPSAVLGFLNQFETHEDNRKVISVLICNYIEQQVDMGELQRWTIALISGRETEGLCHINGLDVRLIKRSPKPQVPIDMQKAEKRYLIRRLLAPRDEAIDLNHDAYDAALQQTKQQWQSDPGRSRRKEPPDTPSGPSIRTQRDSGSGLLLLYPLCSSAAQIDTEIPVMGFGISFPNSVHASKVAYIVDNVYWSQEFGREL